MKTRMLLPLALAGLTGCAVYTPVGYRGAHVHREPIVIVQPAPAPARPTYRDRDRDRDRDGVPDRYDRRPRDPSRY